MKSAWYALLVMTRIWHGSRLVFVGRWRQCGTRIFKFTRNLSSVNPRLISLTSNWGVTPFFIRNIDRETLQRRLVAEVRVPPSEAIEHV